MSVTAGRWNANDNASIREDFKARGMEEAERSLGITFKRSGSTWRSRCPVHGGESDTSFAWDPVKRTFHCFSRPGCFQGDIFQLLETVKGTPFKETMEALRSHPQHRAQAPHVTPLPPKQAAAIRVPPATPEPAKREGLAGRWAYTDADGQLLGYVDRINDAGGKSFRPWQWDGDGWIAKSLPTPRPLYGLHDLAVRPDAPVLVCEGEKSTDAARRLFPGHVCVTSSGGASAAAASDWTPLQDRDVTVWPDNDEPGAKFAQTVAGILSKLGTAVRIVAIPSDWPAKWDLADEEPASYRPGDGARLLAEAQPYEAISPDEEWPEPEPLPEAVAFPGLSDFMPATGRARIHDLLPPELATYLESVAASQELTPESVIVAALPKVVLAIGPDVLAKGNGEHVETLSVWEMAVLPPGGRKSAGFAASQGALSELRDNLEAKGRERRAEWFARESCREQEEKVLKAGTGAYFAGKHGGAKAGSKPPTVCDMENFRARLAEIAVERLSDRDPGRVEIYSSNATPEAVVERVAAARCFAMLSAEGATVIEGLAEYRGGDDGAPIGHWCSLYSGDEVRSTRAGRETLTIPSKSATLSVGITLQRDVLDRAGENRSMRTRGFLTRFSKYVATPSEVSGAKPPPRNEHAERWFDDTLRRIAANRPSATTYIACSPEAATMLREFELECRGRAANLDDFGDVPALAEWSCKAHGMALRRGALLHTLQGFDYSTPISARTLGWGIELTRFNLETEVVLVQSGRGGLPRRLHRFGELVRQSGLSELTARIAAKRGWAPDVETARTLLGHLVEHKWLGVEVRKDARAGRPSTVYVVNPRILPPHHGPGKTDKTAAEVSFAGFAGGFPRNQIPGLPLDQEQPANPVPGDWGHEVPGASLPPDSQAFIDEARQRTAIPPAEDLGGEL